MHILSISAVKTSKCPQKHTYAFFCLVKFAVQSRNNILKRVSASKSCCQAEKWMELETIKFFTSFHKGERTWKIINENT